MANPAPPSLDRTGTQAAIYPSEEALWAQGPPINDPGSQGVEWPAGSPPAPASLSAATATEEWISETLNGETANEAFYEDVVNPAVHGPQGFGDWNVQPFYTGHSQNRPSDPSSEQGWGVGPARRWAHYPKVESPNPARNEGQHLRNGQLPWVSADTALYYRTQLAWEQQWAPFKFRSPHAAVVPVPSSVPFAQTVPTFGGGDVPHPGVDVPFDDAAIYGIYPTGP